MTQTKALACCVCLIAVGVAPVAADTTLNAPKSLHMRSRPSVGSHWLPMRWGKRVAQAPSPDQPPPGGDQPPADGAGAPATPGPDAAQPAAGNPPAPQQDAAPVAPAPAPAPAVNETPNLSDDELDKLAEQDAKEEVITVTGSTIERKSLTTTAPLTILSREDLNAAGRSTVGDIIQQLPAQSNGINAQVNNGGDGSTRIDIRGLGAARTLTLINGRRVVAGGVGANSSVDVNSIPLAVIDRVEVLKDGASAIYGSDAIGGVVNIITRNDFNGTEAAIYTGGAQRRDGFTYDASVVTGHNSENKKGNIVFAAGFQSQDPVMAGDRDQSKTDKDFNFATRTGQAGGSPTNPSGRYATNAIDKNHNGKADDVFDLCGLDEKGVPLLVCTNDPNAPGGYRPYLDSDLYNFAPLNYLYTPSQRYNVFTAGTYRFRPEVNAFFEASYLNRTSDQMLAPEPLTMAKGLFISENSVYNPFQANVLTYNRRLEEFGNRRFLQSINTFRMVGGAQGAIPEDAQVLSNWKWEVSYNFGRTDSTQRNEGSLVLSRVANAIGPSYRDSAGVARCGTAAAPIGGGCVPMDILGAPGSISPEAKGYATFTGITAGYNSQQTALATAHGRLAKLPNNGDLSMAIGTDFRREGGGRTPDPITAAGDTTGNAIKPTSGAYNVFEAFGELSLVPISGQKFAQWVELDVAARAFRYDSFGSGVTWKAGGLFRTIGGVAVRGTYSTAFRAPSINDMFQGPADGFPSVFDPCDTRPPGSTMATPVVGVAATKCEGQGVPTNAVYNTRQQRAVSIGNQNLEAETAKVITAGVVYEPPQVKGLGLTVDYWNIDISNAIQQLGSAVILANCYTRGMDDYCQLVHRNAAANYAIDFIEDTRLNVGGTRTSGIDGAASYDRKLGKMGRIQPRLELQYLLKYNLDNEVQVVHGLGNYDLGVYPRWKANFSTIWGHPSGAGAGVNVKFVGKFKECLNNNCNGGAAARDVAHWYKLDLFGTYALKSPAGKTSLTVGVNNILDRAPSLIYIGLQGDSDATTYDYMGRFFYARVSQAF